MPEQYELGSDPCPIAAAAKATLPVHCQRMFTERERAGRRRLMLYISLHCRNPEHAAYHYNALRWQCGDCMAKLTREILGR